MEEDQLTHIDLFKCVDIIWDEVIIKKEEYVTNSEVKEKNNGRVKKERKGLR